MTETERLPAAIRSDSFNIFGVEVHCRILEDGRRVLDLDDVNAMMTAGRAAIQQMEAFVRWLRDEGPS